MDRFRTRYTAIAGAVALALAAAPAAAARIDYVLDAGVEHDDNPRLVPVDPDGQRILRAGLGFLVTQEGSTVQAMVAGRADYREFQRGLDDGVEGMLSAYLNWVAIPDRLSFTLRDELELQAIDRFDADSPDNRQQVNVLSFGPNLLFDVGSRLQGRFEARYIDSHAEVTDAFNSSRVGAALRLTHEFDDRSNLGFNAQWSDVDYDVDLVARDHERTDVYARYERVQASTDYAIDAGYTRLDYADGETRDGPLVRLEAGWRPAERGRLSATLINQFSDAADAALAEGIAIGGGSGGEPVVPGSVLVDDGTIIPSAYRERRVALAWDQQGERLGWRIEGHVQRLRYIDTLVADEKEQGIMLGVDYRLTPTMTLTGWASAERTEYVQLAAEDDTRRAGLVLEKRWTPHWATSLSWYRYERDSGVFDNEVRQNVWYLWVSYGNRPR
ncbi:hypothetical protein GCM10007164_02770 [Luteimonas padinae]|uniref:Outer membrane beta-barrel protein n=1 Tax=Luteimonas padinae TaxID=1714359 RepID=A0ABV6SXF8_9GAMM|nr:hypothetical protein [Luteimonas padinae]GHD65415.1 hypothetical protein GCM10007164_02770 [Luteimonas padinae]